MTRHISAVPATVIAILSLIAGTAYAQIPNIVSASAVLRPSAVAPGGKGLLVVTFSVKPGFHIYPSKTTDPDLIPTQFAPNVISGIHFGSSRFSAAKMVKLASEPGPIAVYEGTGTIVTPFAVSKAAHSGTRSITASLSYQACNSTSCYPPATKNIAVTLPIK